MPALERLHGRRVVASPDALDAARWIGQVRGVTVLRFSPDEAFGLSAEGVEIDDPHAIVVNEAGFVGAWLTSDQLDHHVVPHVEWSIPVDRPGLAQGSIAGVPAKLWLAADGTALLLAPAPFGDELAARLGFGR